MFNLLGLLLSILWCYILYIRVVLSFIELVCRIIVEGVGGCWGYILFVNIVIKYIKF